MDYLVGCMSYIFFCVTKFPFTVHVPGRVWSGTAFAKRSGAMKAPVGNALFVGIKVGRTTLAKVMPYMLMYYAAIILGLLLVTYIPAVSMVLPQVTGLV